MNLMEEPETQKYVTEKSSSPESRVVVEERQESCGGLQKDVAMVEAYGLDLSRVEVKLEGPHRASRVELD